ncbi:hypothetical protein P9265_05185 [Schinkia azotoformans]|uniref:hypothetical protein n=1 Tax=Schinkia azotoformans TaxID=1454 RepID=UPI002E22E871|nr:hypothetical protein [Schinkia azotoformans]
MILQNKNTVMAAIMKKGHWTGFLAANFVNPAQITGPWCLGIKVTLTTLDEMENTLAKFTCYNGNGELGKRVSFYEMSKS